MESGVRQVPGGQNGRRPRAWRRPALWLAVVAAWGSLAAPPVLGQYLRIRDICRVKGQEQNTLNGLGIVVGLNGTGDADATTKRALGKLLGQMGNALPHTADGQFDIKDLENVKNAALVFVSATVPAEGARQGEQLDCAVNAISAKSLEGGYLVTTPLLGPLPQDRRVYALAQGRLALDKEGPPTSGRIPGGTRMEVDLRNQFTQEGKITLVLDSDHASFRTAFDIEELLNDPKVSGFGLTTDAANRSVPVQIARAIDQVNIEVNIPAVYNTDPVGFVSAVLDTRIVPPRPDARVVLDKRNGIIVVGENVMVGRVAVSHRNIAVQTGDDPLRIVDQGLDTSTTRLQALVDALNALKVGTDDIISIIESLKRSGDLYGHVITP